MNTKDFIVEKTLKLILKKGAIDISISEIRNCTGLTTGGIYYHFSDKSEIFEAIMQKYIVDYMKIDFDKIPLEGSSKERIHDGLLYILHHFTDGVEIESVNEKINLSKMVKGKMKSEKTFQLKTLPNHCISCIWEFNAFG